MNVVTVDHLSKTFLTRDASSSRSRGGFGRRGPTRPLSVLVDVSFTIQPGESVALLGGNGSGKTTLLRLLAGIFRPTTGSVHTEGLLVPLLALGAGFNDQLSGRDNIRLNASLLGIPKAVVRRDADSIIEYSGLEEGIDRPVGQYSSGMRARLGFSIAVHSDPAILLLDEIFSVGDASFRKSAMEAVEAMKMKGTAIVIASHEPGVVQRIASRKLVLQSGRIAEDSDV